MSKRLSATCWLLTASEASAPGDHRVNHAVVLEEHQKGVVVPAWDRGLTDRGGARERGTEMLFDLAHGAAAPGAIQPGLTQLHLVVHHDGVGDCRAGERATAQERCQNSGLHATVLPTAARL